VDGADQRMGDPVEIKVREYDFTLRTHEVERIFARANQLICFTRG